jgi:acetyl/propionyl-CoA carboxylase alpha subunit
MLAKVMARGPDRDTALRTVRRAVASVEVAGLQTNQLFLLRALSHPAFESGRVTTRFVHHYRDELTSAPDEDDCLRGALLAALQRWRLRTAHAAHGTGARTYRMRVGSRQMGVAIRALGDQRYLGVVDERQFQLEVLEAEDERSLVVAIDGHAARHAVIVSGDVTYVTLRSTGALRVEFLSRFRKDSTPESRGHYRAPMTGRILDVMVQCGAPVRAGDRLVTMESMKMEHATLAGSDGIVTRLWASPGDIVEQGTLLVEIEVAAAVDTGRSRGG